MSVNQTTSNKENGVEHPSTSQLDQDIQAFSKEEMDRLRALLNSTSKPLDSCGLTMNGKSSFNISGSVPQSIWILDSGATDHMTSLELCSDIFSFYVIYELTMGRTIGIAKEQGGLYYLQHTKIGNNTNKEKLPSSQRATSKTWAASQIWLYHKRLGHPPFGLLKTMFPHLFTKESVESFKCDICQFSKHHRATFLLVIIKVLNLLTSFILMCGGQLVTLYRGKSGLYRLLMIVPVFVKYLLIFFILSKINLISPLNLEFSKFLKDNGVVHELTCLNTPPTKWGCRKEKSSPP
ncbi:hypothetical protein CR513_51581, partial [Mucuna pruriens]